MQELWDWKLTSVACVVTGAVILGSVYLFKKLDTGKQVLIRSVKPVISHIVLYPIKGCRGIERYSAELTSNGLKHDREFAIVVIDATDKTRCTSLSQTKYPKLALVEPTIPTDAGFVLTCPNMPSLHVPTGTDGPEYILDFYGDEIVVSDQGNLVSSWFSEYLNIDCRFVRIAPGKRRQTKGSSEWKDSSIFFRTPVLLTSEETMSELSRQVGHHIEYARFRPNIVLSNLGAPFTEDQGARWIVDGRVELEGVQLCDRCSVPGVNPRTGVLETHLIAKMRELRNGKKIANRINFKYSATTLEDQYYVAVYCQPNIEGSTRICIGQEVKQKNEYLFVNVFKFLFSAMLLIFMAAHAGAAVAAMRVARIANETPQLINPMLRQLVKFQHIGFGQLIGPVWTGTLVCVLIFYVALLIRHQYMQEPAVRYLGMAKFWGSTVYYFEDTETKTITMYNPPTAFAVTTVLLIISSILLVLNATADCPVTPEELTSADSFNSYATKWHHSRRQHFQNSSGFF